MGRNLPVVRHASSLLQRLQLFPWLKAYCFPGRNCHLRASPRVTSDAGLSRPDIEDPKTPKFDVLALTERSFHRLEDGLHGHLGLGLCDASFVDDFVDDVELDQKGLLGSENP